MMLTPARLAFDAAGTPYSEQFGDVYHSADGGLEQARHVFLGGNGLPARWRGRRSFVVLETGFGFGLNFLATW
ncbi:MAG TPA: bifunctional tRNA (5-methylaminomethyl-2-thiouridine)(34)-methyltransferase MnmD/FAD-dependent 5-carboxymethylaminomethyl-2-thiouridine(34) oxidoreductase MnmC, partial [Rhodocyclaceae bacterium]|nr:bifunctional tRNA (5-methylaminomethyl-2-thiouridine)(34)-methyltransferase MnmD/FAD-dependent 5-carboxymethylaminomethyl-2-thiouridine(34) oxidoreductase MnmC [Rhodocyclaceae bacterium]